MEPRKIASINVSLTEVDKNYDTADLKLQGKLSSQTNAEERKNEDVNNLTDVEKMQRGLLTAEEVDKLLSD